MYAIRSYYDPDGTIFYAQDSQKYYYIKNKERHEIPNKTILDSYLRIAPVTVQQESLEKSIECEIHSHIRELGFFHCQASINPIENFTRITSYNVCYTKLLRPSPH